MAGVAEPALSATLSTTVTPLDSLRGPSYGHRSPKESPMLVAVPSEAPGGLDARACAHFGHCATFTLVAIEDGRLGEVTVLDNEAHAHAGCMAPVMLLKAHGADALLTAGIGEHALGALRQVEISVYHARDADSVRDAIERYLAGDCAHLAEAQGCGGGECASHHHHEEVERDPIDGVADVRVDRVVSLGYRLRDREGNLLEASDADGPLRYLHGHGNILPGLERALTGLEAGAERLVELSAAEAYGERDESRIFEVPRDELPGRLAVGDRLRARLEDGRMVTLTVVALADGSVRLDPNHPLAGKDLVFDVTVVKVESATATELEHGHVH
jgi:FKBP-type peptidyl-prolyl cis-trans isomerase SlyD